MFFYQKKRAVHERFIVQVLGFLFVVSIPWNIEQPLLLPLLLDKKAQMTRFCGFLECFDCAVVQHWGLFSTRQRIRSAKAQSSSVRVQSKRWMIEQLLTEIAKHSCDFGVRGTWWA